MNINIGEKIKKLRKARGITQEELAESLGISFQAISKWENRIALPDITMAPAIASYFGITMDELFDFNLKEVDRKIEAITTEAYRYRESDYKKSREILEEGLKKYPDNDILLANLLYVLDDPDESIKVANHLINKTDDAELKYEAYRFLAYAYRDKGEIDNAVAAVEQIPEIYFTKLSELAFVLENGNEKNIAATKQKWISFESTLQMMWKLAECLEADGKISKAISETEKALHLIACMENDNFENYRSFFEKEIVRMKEHNKS